MPTEPIHQDECPECSGADDFGHRTGCSLAVDLTRCSECGSPLEPTDRDALCSPCDEWLQQQDGAPDCLVGAEVDAWHAGIPLYGPIP